MLMCSLLCRRGLVMCRLGVAIFLLQLVVHGLGNPQGQPQAGSPSTPGPGGGGGGGAPGSGGSGVATGTGSSAPGGGGGGGGTGGGGVNVVRRSRGWLESRRGDPTLIKTMVWQSRTPLGNAEVYIILALLIGFVTVVVGCWLSDNCWSPDPEPIITLA